MAQDTTEIRWRRLDFEEGIVDATEPMVELGRAITGSVGIAQEYLSAASGALQTAASTIQLAASPVRFAMELLVEQVREYLNNIAATGLYLLAHHNLGNPDGMRGWLDTAHQSIYDRGDLNRPQGTKTSYAGGAIIVAAAPTFDHSLQSSLKTLGRLFSIKELEQIGEDFALDAFGAKASLTVGSAATYDLMTFEATEGGEAGNQIEVEVTRDATAPTQFVSEGSKIRFEIGKATSMLQCIRAWVGNASGDLLDGWLHAIARDPGGQGNGVRVSLLIAPDETLHARWGNRRMVCTAPIGTTPMQIAQTINAVGRGVVVEVARNGQRPLGSWDKTVTLGGGLDLPLPVRLSSPFLLPPLVAGVSLTPPPPATPPTRLSGGRSARAHFAYNRWGNAALSFPRKSRAPDWRREPLPGLLSSVKRVSGVLDGVLGSLSFAPAAGVGIDKLASLLRRKSALIGRLSRDLDSVLLDLERIAQFGGNVYLLTIPQDLDEVLPGGPDAFFSRAKLAPGLPDLGLHGLVAGVVVLASSPEDYATLRALLGDAEEVLS